VADMSSNVSALTRQHIEISDSSWMFDAHTPRRRKAQELARRVAGSSCPVLILGPTGVGKEVLASDIHRNSTRRNGPFIAVNCAAFTTALFESAFFGHVRGSFTGAMQDKPGLVELAHGGTLFLDEVGELPPDIQAKLLRFVAQGTYWPVGGTTERRVDVRILSATHRDIDTTNDAFREDLFFRLSVVLIRIPPLETRDIQSIARSVAVEAMYRHEKRLSELDIDRLAESCTAREWKGGARELRNVIERFMVLLNSDQPIEDEISEALGIEPPAVKSGVRQCSVNPAVAKDLDNLVFLGIAEECVDVRQLADRTDRTVQAVYGRLRKLGLEPHDVGHTANLEAALLRLRQRITPELPWIQALLTG
jgi:transcriptional regulator with PAS, ATPase and Fis domain